MPELLEHERLIVSQKAKLIELTNEYKIRDEQGNEVGAIRQEGQSGLRKLLRLVSSIDALLPVTLSVYDAGGRKVAGLRRGATVWKSKIEVTDGSGGVVGRLVQENMVGKVRFGIEGAGGVRLGEMKAENWRAWDFAISDISGAEVARITKKWAGLGKEMFTTADNYVVELTPQATGPLRLIVLAAAAGIDTALKQQGG
ncbi:MAG TPA: phospholipid scramblase-related protein [Acidimicrobiales bacterium]|nr:phospholipid scramblase-related protein [Acidimicrobiales bacterium]